MTNRLFDKKLFFILASCVSTIACTQGDGPSSAPEDGQAPLVVTTTDASGFRAETRIDDELVTIEVRRSTRALAVEGDGSDDGTSTPVEETSEDVDTVRVLGSHGVVYATYSTTLDRTDADGSFGSLRFGGAAEEEPAAFSRVLHDRVGRVVSQLVTSSRETEARPGLAVLTAMKNDLFQLAGEESAEMQAGVEEPDDEGDGPSPDHGELSIRSNGASGKKDVCDFKWTSTARMGFLFQKCELQGIDVDDRCRVNVAALFGKIAPQKCKRTYSARIYSDKGTLLAQKSGNVSYSGYLTGLYDKKTYEANVSAGRWLSRKPGSKVCFKTRFGDSTGRKYASSVRCQVVKLRRANTSAGDYDYVLWDSWK